MLNADDLICAAARGERPAWPWGADASAIAEILRRSDINGVRALLHHQLPPAGWPAALVLQLRDRAIQDAMWELRHQQLLNETLQALHQVGVRPVLIKGTALAYSLYADPVLRTRGDTDLIISGDAKKATHEALIALGFERNPGVTGQFVSYQASYSKPGVDGSSHTLDLHWKINNSEVLAGLFTYEELLGEAKALPKLGPHALGNLGVQALLLACMHRCTHKQNPYYVNGEAHHTADRLIWLYDIHLLSAHFSVLEWDRLVQLATEKGLRAICLDGMKTAQACFHTVYPSAVLQALARPGPPEPAARYLNGSKLRQQWMDYRALGSFTRQLRFLSELFFPPADYMRSKYSQSSSGWLPWLYLHRAAGGVAKRLTASRSR